MGSGRDGIQARLRSQPCTISTNPFKKSLQRRANHVLISIVGRISPRPGNGRGLCHLEFSNRTAARIHGVRIFPCRCIDPRRVLIAPPSKPCYPSLVVQASRLICRRARTCRCAAGRKPPAARGPARDKRLELRRLRSKWRSNTWTKIKSLLPSLFDDRVGLSPRHRWRCDAGGRAHPARRLDHHHCRAVADSSKGQLICGWRSSHFSTDLSSRD